MDIKYSNLMKGLLILTFVGIFLSSLSACKIVNDDGETIFDPSSDSKDVGSSDKGNVDEMPIDVSDGHFTEPYREPIPSELNYIKINGESIDILINPVKDVYRGVKNNATALIEKTSIETIEVGLDNGSEENQYKNYIGVTLRSLAGDKVLSINYDTYRIDDMNGIGISEENINFNYEDNEAGYYSSAYNNGLIGIGDVFQMSNKRFLINIPSLIGFIKDSSQDHFHHETQGDGTVDMSNYDISEQLFADNLFRLEISVGGQIFYRGKTFHSLNSCVFTASDTKPSDIEDICKAYLAMY